MTATPFLSIRFAYRVTLSENLWLRVGALTQREKCGASTTGFMIGHVPDLLCRSCLAKEMTTRRPTA